MTVFSPTPGVIPSLLRLPMLRPSGLRDWRRRRSPLLQFDRRVRSAVRRRLGGRRTVLSLEQTVIDLISDVARLGARAEARVEAELERRLVIDARAAEEPDGPLVDLRFLRRVDEISRVFLVHVT